MTSKWKTIKDAFFKDLYGDLVQWETGNQSLSRRFERVSLSHHKPVVVAKHVPQAAVWGAQGAVVPKEDQDGSLVKGG